MITPELLARSGTEDGEQTAFFCWAQQNAHRFPCLKWMFAIPNGGARSPATAARLKATGVKSGVCDIMLPVSSKGFNGLFIEMKRKDGVPSDIKPAQFDFIEFVQGQGYQAKVAFGWANAVRIIEEYLT